MRWIKLALHSRCIGTQLWSSVSMVSTSLVTYCRPVDVLDRDVGHLRWMSFGIERFDSGYRHKSGCHCYPTYRLSTFVRCNWMGTRMRSSLIDQPGRSWHIHNQLAMPIEWSLCRGRYPFWRCCSTRHIEWSMQKQWRQWLIEKLVWLEHRYMCNATVDLPSV